MATVNEKLLNQQIGRQVDIQLYSERKRREMLKLLTSALAELLEVSNAKLPAIIDAGLDLGANDSKRMADLIASIASIRSELYASVHTNLVDELTEFAPVEAAYQIDMLQKSMPVALNLSTPTVSQLSVIATARPFEGRTLKKWVSDLDKSGLGLIRQQIKLGLVQGQPTREIISRIRGRMDIEAGQLSTLVRTAVNHTSNRVRKEVATGNESVIKGIKIVATLDGRTSAICRSLDNKVFEPDTKKLPPFHMNCRSTFTYVTKSWRELGIDADELPPGSRASMNGQVPGDMSYGDWLRKQDRKFVEGVLGKKKADLFLDGDLKIDRFVNASGRELSLDELKKKNPKAWQKAFSYDSPKVARAAGADYVKHNGVRTNTEHAFAYNPETGERLFAKQGERSSVSFTDKEVTMLRDNPGAVMIHNHPSSTSLSGADLIFTKSTGFSEIVAVGTHETAEYSARVLADSIEQIRRVHNAVGDSIPDFIWPYVRNGKLSPEGANAAHAHLVNLVMNDLKLIEYSYPNLSKHTREGMEALAGEELDNYLHVLTEKAKQWL